MPGLNLGSACRKLVYAGSKKLTRLPRRSAVVAFSTSDVYKIAEFVRRQRGGAAVVMGRLSPRTRNAQVDLYQNGDVDFFDRDRCYRHGAEFGFGPCRAGRRY